ncbi:MAG: P1 family peptidase [Gemmatimonadales bacterium]|nr:P1 family peptidase [Gemmatimonadales bacterium]
MRWYLPVGCACLGALLTTPIAAAQGIRARDLGIPFDGVPGPLNAITDVPGVEVGHVTIIRGNGPLVKGEGPVRTGVTAILPRGRHFDPVHAAWYALNGNGEMTGLPWIEESGFLETPLMITNTFSVGVVRDAVIAWMDSTGYHGPDPIWYSYPLVAETYDVLNDILGQHVTRSHAFQALDAARPGPVAEGSVGGGTGMIAHEFKGGIGTASRLTGSGHTLGVLVQANHGGRKRFTVAGVPVGREIADLQANWDVLFRARGSIIVVVATDAPLLPTQLQRLAERVPIGIGRLGGLGENSSGDIFVAFSTGNPGAWGGGTDGIKMLPNAAMDALFEATVDATEEAILNAMVAAETMTGRDSLTVFALPHDRLQAALRKYNRLVDPASLPRPAAITPAAMERIVGTYRLVEPGIKRRIYVEGGMLFLERGGGGRNRLLPIADRRFLLLGDGIVFEEVVSEAGRPLRFRGTVNGEPFVTLERTRPE